MKTEVGREMEIENNWERGQYHFADDGKKDGANGSVAGDLGEHGRCEGKQQNGQRRRQDLEGLQVFHQDR